MSVRSSQRDSLDAASPIFDEPNAASPIFDEPDAAEPLVIQEFISPPSATEITDFLSTDTVGEIDRCPHLFWHPIQAAGWMIRMVFGIICLVAMLAIISAIPIVNFLALGYMLEVEGRMARTGKLRFAFPLLDLAPRLGSIVIGIWVCVLPIRFLAGSAAAAAIIEPGSGTAAFLNGLKYVVSIGMTVHLCLALARGGTFGCFLRPIKNLRWLIRRIGDGDYLETAERGVVDFVTRLRLQHHFWLGFRGFVGAFAWLLIPTLLYASFQSALKPGQLLLTIPGGVMLLVVFQWVPFLQARFAGEQRLRAMFELRAIRDLFKRTPIAWLISIILIYVLSLPMYLFKIVLPPRDALWSVTFVFIISIYPAKVLTGWAYHRAAVRPNHAWFGWRWVSRTVMIPLLALYVFLLFFTPAIAEHGRQVLYEHQAFLLPFPSLFGVFTN